MMIVGRVEEQEWKSECLRLEKKLAEIGTAAKDARKRGVYVNVETARMSQAVNIFQYRDYSTWYIPSSQQHQVFFDRLMVILKKYLQERKKSDLLSAAVPKPTVKETKKPRT